MRIVVAIAIAGAMLVPAGSFAHGGGLNAEGCHNDRKRGGYHCHGSKTSSAAEKPAETAVRPVQAFSRPSAFASTTAIALPPATDIATQSRITGIQLALTKLGYDPGPADGSIHAKTELAIAQYKVDASQTYDVQDYEAIFQVVTLAALRK